MAHAADDEKAVEQVHDNGSKTFTIGSWNVHGWCDGKGVPNADRLIKGLKQTPCDILCLEEVYQECQTDEGLVKFSAINYFKQSLNYKYESKFENNERYEDFVCTIFKSNFKLIETFSGKHRFLLNVVEYCINNDDKNGAKNDNNNNNNNSNNNNKNDEKKDGNIVMVGVICVHFHVINEEIRLDELKKYLIPLIESCNKKYPQCKAMVMLGDFNALNISDYTIDEWNEISNQRQLAMWELPKHELIDTILFKHKLLQFQDCLDYLRLKKIKEKEKEQELEKENKEENKNKNEIENKDDKKEILKDVVNVELKDRHAKDKDQWKSVLGNGKLGTCRFGTHIDFVFVNQEFLNIFHVLKLEHLPHNDASDHVLVRAHFSAR